MRTRPAVLTYLVGVVLFVLSSPPARGEEEDPFDAARRLAAEGEDVEAFRAYLAVPGAEHHAARLGRTSKADLLGETETLLASATDAASRRRVLLVRGDLHLQRDEREAALDAYRNVTELLPRHPDAEWQSGRVSPNAYPVEAPADRAFLGNGRLFPFAVGPGSHRDNWLLRRFLALEAWPEAEAEFQRLWAFHDTVAGAGPYSTPALQFAIDYAYFLKLRGEGERARTLLLEPLRRVDMDHVPPFAAGREVQALLRPYGGIARKEYVRLVHGAFREAGREADLVDALEADVEQGRNEARRVLARLHEQAGRLDAAVGEELAYIEAASFDMASRAVRRGRVYEEVKRLPEAIAAYEEALTLPPSPLDLPDPDEDARLQHTYAASVSFSALPDARHQRLDLLRRMERLHAALGRPDRVLLYALRSLGADPERQKRLPELESGLRRFRTGGQEEEYRAWLKTLVESSDVPVVRANAAWVLGDVLTAADHVVEARTYLGEQGLDRWMQLFQEQDAAAYSALLERLVSADPAHGRARLQLLHVCDVLEGDDAAKLFEDLLDGRAHYRLDRRHEPWARTRLTSWGDVAYRLMRIYERRGDEEAMARLALRIARSEAPFDRRIGDGLEFRDGNDVPEQLPASLAVAVQAIGSEERLEALYAALAGSPWEAVRKQVERRREAAWPAGAEAVDSGWANLPPGVRLLACNEDVLSLAADEANVYAGHPWGVAVYDLGGRPRTRVALGCAALSLTVGPEALWVGTPLGVHRVALDDHAVSRLLGDQDLNPRRNVDDHDRFRDHAAWAVAFHADRLWIGTIRDVRSFDPTTGALRVYASDELQLEERGDWDRFFVDGDDLWVEGYHGARWYDRERDRWLAPHLEGEQARVQVLGRAAGALWGDVYVDQRLGERPCRLVAAPGGAGVRAEVLAVDPVVRDRVGLGGRPWSLHGTWEGRPVFGTQGPAFFLDADSGTLLPLPATPDGVVLPVSVDGAVAEGLQWSRVRPHAGGLVRGRAETGNGQVRHGSFRTADWSSLHLDDGTLVLGGRANDRRHRYPREGGEPYFREHPREGSRDLGGLWFFPRGGDGRRVSRTASADALPDDRVLAAVFEEANAGGRRLWLATPSGLAVLDGELRARATLGRAEGLVADRFHAAAAVAGKLYFGSGWDDRGGGLTVFDPATRVFTSLHAPDGLATERVAGLAAASGKLKIRYGLQYRRWADDKGLQRHEPGTYDPAANSFGPRGGVQRFNDRNEVPRSKRRDDLAPWLGGYVSSVHEVGGLRVLCTTHGLVSTRSDDVPPLVVPVLDSTLVPDQPFLLRLAAQRRQMRVQTIEELRGYVEDPNPYVRARALGLATHAHFHSAACIQVARPVLDEDLAFVRRAATRFLAALRESEARPLLERAQRDPDSEVRDHAALGLARLGVVPDLRVLERLLARAGNSYYSNGFEFYATLAAVPTPEVTALFLRFPLPTDDYAPRLEAMARMGLALVDHPASVELLLRARDTRRRSFASTRFAERVLAGGGSALLDRLHAALCDPDRVVRSNAARALGFIGDPSSVAPLIAALEPESGLSRASAVWALGELRAAEAVPHLVRLYADARIDQRRRAGAGFRIGQAHAAIRGAYEVNASPEGISRDWTELRPPRAEPIHPLDEVLLSPDGILEAVAAIGADAAQAFYRSIASEPGGATRREAARQLANGSASDREANFMVLQSLRTSDDLAVRVAATVSLWVLEGAAEYEASIRSWLEGEARDAKDAVLVELLRVADKERLVGLRPALQALLDDPDATDGWRRRARQLLSGP